MVSQLDVFFVLVFIIVVSTIIGLNIVNLIDKKLNRVEINVPKVQIPKPEITVHILKEDDGSFKTCVNQKYEYEKKKPELVEVSNENIKKEIEGFTNKLENPKLVQEIELHENDDLKDLQSSNTKKNLDKSNVIEKPAETIAERTTKIQKDDVYKHNPVFHSQEIDSRGYCLGNQCVDSTKKYVKVSENQRPSSNFKPMTPFMVQAQVSEIKNISEYYKTYQPPKTYLVDPKMRGSNYEEYTKYIKPHQVDMKLVPGKLRGYKVGNYGTQNVPVAHNYVFHDSPANKE